MCNANVSDFKRTPGFCNENHNFDVAIVEYVGIEKNVLEFGEDPYKVLVRTIVTTKLSSFDEKYQCSHCECSAPLLIFKCFLK